MRDAPSLGTPLAPGFAARDAHRARLALSRQHRPGDRGDGQQQENVHDAADRLEDQFDDDPERDERDGEPKKQGHVISRSEAVGVDASGRLRIAHRGSQCPVRSTVAPEKFSVVTFFPFSSERTYVTSAQT